MAQVKKIAMAAGTFSVALGIGFVMQNGDALASRFGPDDAPAPATFAASPDTPLVTVQAGITAPSPVTEVETAQLATVGQPLHTPKLQPSAPFEETSVALPQVESLTETPQPPVQLASIDTEDMPQVGAPELGDAVTVETDCVPTMMAAPAPAAMVDLALSAPCHTNSPFTVHHQGMMFTAMTNEDGTSKVTVPALAEVAVIIAAFPNGDGAVATATVPDFALYDRAVLQWQGRPDVMLSAYENGANFGDPSHIFADNPGDLARLDTAQGGHLIRLGSDTVDNPLMAEVYTFPSSAAGSMSDVILVAEAEITAENCGNELAAQSIQVFPDGATSALDLTLVMPDCDAVGDFLILQNMFEDLKLASR